MPWTYAPSLIAYREGLAAAVCDAPSPASGYRIYAIGGNDGSGPVATVEAYDTSVKSWSPIAAMITARENPAATSGPGRLYALGGDDGTNALTTLEIYDPAADTWASGPSMSTARSGLATVTGRDGIIYAMGGLNGSSNAPTYLATVEAFDPSTSTWTARSSMSAARAKFAAVVGPDGLIYAIGGENSTGTLNSVVVFNPSTNSWSGGPPVPNAVFGIAAAVGPDGLIYLLSGVDNGDYAGLD